MKLVRLTIEGFRGYQEPVSIRIDELTTIVGKNDAGKSTILEALEIFFNNKTVKIDSDDGCKVGNVDQKKIRIGCVFADLPEKIVLDALTSTTLASEELLNSDGELEIHKTYDCSLKTPKVRVTICAEHRLLEDGKCLLSLTNAELKKLVKTSGETVSDNKQNPLLRAAIRKGLTGAKVAVELPMDEKNSKSIFVQIEKTLPVFALFQSDRPSTDSDTEVQDPMKAAIDVALKTASAELDKAQEIVIGEVRDVIQRTLDKLQDMAPDLASELQPRIDAPKWKSAFSVKLDSDNGVPLNKRGSGVRRLILLNFFRAEAERRQSNADTESIIFAVEEPETSQHPGNQRLLIDAFKTLADSGNAQVLLTTHVPGLAGLVPVSSLRFVDKDADGKRSVVAASSEDDNILCQIAETLGVIPDSRVQVLCCVEGPNDVHFCWNITRILANSDERIRDLSTDKTIAFVPLGGRSLEQWVEYHYLSELNRPEFHLYDGDFAGDAKIGSAINEVNARTDGSMAMTLKRRAAESYLHADAIERCFGVAVEWQSDDCVPTAVMARMHETNSKIPLGGGRMAKPHKNVVKRMLNNEVAALMTEEELKQVDPEQELAEVFSKLCAMISGG
jgi:energy-coupling factor transporter ATP-binding protein EcfA2